MSKEEVQPEQKEWTSSLDQEEQEPAHIKEEQEELWTNQEEDDVTRFTFTAVIVKSEDDDEKKPQSTQMETEAEGEDCGGPEPDRNSDPDQQIQPVHEVRMNTDVTLTDVGLGPGEKRFGCSDCGRRFRHRGRETLQLRRVQEKIPSHRDPGPSLEVSIRRKTIQLLVL